MTYCTIDLEFCTIPPQKRISKRLSKEIIQIGCVFMNESFEITKTFRSYVRPSYGGTLDKYVMRLTGINDSDLDNAPSWKEVLKYLLSLIDENTYFVTWSENDCKQLEMQLDLELYATGRELDVSDCFVDCLCDYIDVQEIFSEIMNTRRKYRLSEALWISNVADCCNNYHDAFADAYNTALLFKKTQLEEKFTFSPYYIPSDLIETLHYDPFKQRCLA